MNKLILAAAASLLAANFAFAQAAVAAEKKAPSEKQARQQERMKACSKEAGDKKLKGEGRKKFMSECLKADKPAEAKPAEAAKPAAAAQAKPAEKK